MLKQCQFKIVHAHKNECSRFFSEWDLELFNINISGPLLNWVSFVLFALKGKKPCYFMFAIWVDWEVLDWSRGAPDLTPCGWVCYLLCWEVRIQESAFESAVHPLLEFQQWPQEKPSSIYWLQGFFKGTFSMAGPRKVQHHGQSVSGTHSWKHFFPLDCTFSPSTQDTFVGFVFCGLFWFFFSAVFSYQALSFPLYQENVAAFTPEEPAGWQASETEGQS